MMKEERREKVIKKRKRIKDEMKIGMIGKILKAGKSH